MYVYIYDILIYNTYFSLPICIMHCWPSCSHFRFQHLFGVYKADQQAYFMEIRGAVSGLHTRICIQQKASISVE